MDRGQDLPAQLGCAPGLARALLPRDQQPDHARQRSLSVERGRHADADPEGSAAAGFSILRPGEVREEMMMNKISTGVVALARLSTLMATMMLTTGDGRAADEAKYPTNW